MAHAYSLPSTAAAAPTACLDAIFFEIRIIRMARTRVQVRLGIIVGPLIFVLYEETNRRAERDSHLRTRLEVYSVLLVPLNENNQYIGCKNDRNGESYRGGEVGLTRSASAELNLDICGCER
jgi:hypothetical protein